MRLIWSGKLTVGAMVSHQGWQTVRIYLSLIVYILLQQYLQIHLLDAWQHGGNICTLGFHSPIPALMVLKATLTFQSKTVFTN